MIYCKKCYRDYKTRSSLNRHLKNCKGVVDEYYEKEKEIMKCELCEKEYIERKSYEIHIMMQPLCIRGYIECELCKKRLKTVKENNNHKKECKGKIEYEIDIKKGKIRLEFD